MVNKAENEAIEETIAAINCKARDAIDILSRAIL